MVEQEKEYLSHWHYLPVEASFRDRKWVPTNRCVQPGVKDPGKSGAWRLANSKQPQEWFAGTEQLPSVLAVTCFAHTSHPKLLPK